MLDHIQKFCENFQRRYDINRLVWLSCLKCISEKCLIFHVSGCDFLLFAFVNRVMRSCQSFPKTTSTGNMLKIHKSYSFKHIDAFRKHSFLFGEWDRSSLLIQISRKIIHHLISFVIIWFPFSCQMLCKEVFIFCFEFWLSFISRVQLILSTDLPLLEEGRGGSYFMNNHMINATMRKIYKCAYIIQMCPFCIFIIMILCIPRIT